METSCFDDSRLSRQGNAEDKSIVSEKENQAGNELPARTDTKDSEAYLELIDDLAIAEQMLEDYEAHGIERTTLYTEYRANRLGSNTSMRV